MADLKPGNLDVNSVRAASGSSSHLYLPILVQMWIYIGRPWKRYPEIIGAFVNFGILFNFSAY